MKNIFLGLGSNLGERRENLSAALERLEDRGIKVVKMSGIYETEPYGDKDQPWFLNMAVEVETDLLPSELLNTLKLIEKELGRKRTRKWGPRVIDIDILLYGDEIVDIPELRIPHKFMQERKFVLVPLAEIAGKRQHPLLKKSIQELLNECGDVSILRPL